MDIMQKGGAVLGQAVNEPTRQGGGHLEKLIRIEERSHCGVQTNRGHNILLIIRLQHTIGYYHH